jgi:hypothetical protein
VRAGRWCCSGNGASDWSRVDGHACRPGLGAWRTSCAGRRCSQSTHMAQRPAWPLSHPAWPGLQGWAVRPLPPIVWNHGCDMRQRVQPLSHRLTHLTCLTHLLQHGHIHKLNSPPDDSDDFWRGVRCVGCVHRHSFADCPAGHPAPPDTNRSCSPCGPALETLS